ncbi:MAG: type II toxin-antitoxin system Phd/YefM family antitoxin [Terrimicrobiaceae bacterium]|nr:type II toxin-antitoxin system Phd/YefM family antitoxin [Terrimicrobiaceae bacterium]
MEITVTQLKAKCLGIVEKVQREKRRVVISRHGRPAAVLIPADQETSAPLFGRAADSTKILGDLMGTGEEWDAGR